MDKVEILRLLNHVRIAQLRRACSSGVKAAESTRYEILHQGNEIAYEQTVMKRTHKSPARLEVVVLSFCMSFSDW